MIYYLLFGFKVRKKIVPHSIYGNSKSIKYTHNLHGWWAIPSIWLNHLRIFRKIIYHLCMNYQKYFFFSKNFICLYLDTFSKEMKTKFIFIPLATNCCENFTPSIWNRNKKIVFLSSKSFSRCCYCYSFSSLHHVPW